MVDGDSDSGVERGAGDGGSPAIVQGTDTNTVAPWPLFLLEAWKRNRAGAAVWIGATAVPALLVGAYIAVAYPGMAMQLPLLLLMAYAVATMLAERNMCRNVMVITEDRDRIAIDEQSWWRDEERQIPDAFKYWTGKRAEAWLYTGPDGRLRPFVAWSGPLPITKESYTAAHVAGIRTTMGAAERVAKHRKRDNAEIARYGLLVLIILAGLLATYLAGNKAIEAFMGTAG